MSFLVLTGSRALQQALASKSGAKKKFHQLHPYPKMDIDFIGDYDAIKSFAVGNRLQSFLPFDNAKKIKGLLGSVHAEFEIAWPGTTAAELIELFSTDQDARIVRSDKYYPAIYPSLDVLYTLKMSHRYLRNSPHFLKTMRDIQLMRELGAKIPERYKAWYEKRQKETYNYSHPSLTVTKDKFFNSSELKYTYDHDDIHKAVAIQDVPAYTHFIKDGEEVMVSKKKWDALPEEIKLNSVLEECYVLAIERSQVPFDYAPTRALSFDIALSKVCTSIASGWWREFAWENYDKVKELYRHTYMTKFKRALRANEIKPYEEKEAKTN